LRNSKHNVYILATDLLWLSLVISSRRLITRCTILGLTVVPLGPKFILVLVWSSKWVVTCLIPSNLTQICNLWRSIRNSHRSYSACWSRHYGCPFWLCIWSASFSFIASYCNFHLFTLLLLSLRLLQNSAIVTSSL